MALKSLKKEKPTSLTLRLTKTAVEQNPGAALLSLSNASSVAFYVVKYDQHESCGSTSDNVKPCVFVIYLSPCTYNRKSVNNCKNNKSPVCNYASASYLLCQSFVIRLSAKRNRLSKPNRQLWTEILALKHGGFFTLLKSVPWSGPLLTPIGPVTGYLKDARGIALHARVWRNIIERGLQPITLIVI